MNAQDLSPAQVLVLDRPNARQRDELIRTSLRWLVARGHLVVAANKRSASHPSEQRITLGRPLDPGAPGDLAQVMALALAAPRRKISGLIRAARQAWGRNLDGFRRDVVLPGLVAQGLVFRRDKRFLLIFSSTRHYRTPAGEELNRRLSTLLSHVRNLPDMMTSDPTRAAAIAAAAGGLVLLVPEVFPHLSSLGDLLRGMPPRRAEAAGTGNADTLGSGGREMGTLGFSIEDLAGIDLSIGNLDAGIDDATTADSADASGADTGGSSDSGGGDGGGGDGGGGGGGGD